MITVCNGAWCFLKRPAENSSEKSRNIYFGVWAGPRPASTAGVVPGLGVSARLENECRCIAVFEYYTCLCLELPFFTSYLRPRSNLGCYMKIEV